MARRSLPLSCLLSQVLVALTVEIDNAYESRAPHRTNLLGGTGPWLTSYGMWANFLRLVPEGGIAASELAGRAGWGKWPHPAQAGMHRWGYVTVQPHPDRPATSHSVVKPTSAGLLAASLWAPLPAEIEARWRLRFGPALIEELDTRATETVRLHDLALPAFLPQLGWSMFTAAPASRHTVPGEHDLVTALANTLHAFAIEYERHSPVALAAAANVLRVVDETGVRLRDIPSPAGISRQAAAWATGQLQPDHLAVEVDGNATRGKVARLTPAGSRAQRDYESRAAAVEDGWASRLGDVVVALRAALEDVVAFDGGASLRAGMEAPDGCWRSRAKPPEVIAHYPMVLHRGAYPDGS